MKKKIMHQKAFAIALAASISTQAIPIYSADSKVVNETSTTNINDVAEVSSNTGLATNAYRTQQEIANMYNSLKISDASSDVISYAEAPNFTNGTYGKLSTDSLTDGLNTFNYIRYITGLSHNVTLNDDYNNSSQAASFVFADQNIFTHSIDDSNKPTNMSTNDFEDAKLGASKSNIAAGRSNLYSNIVGGWMSDADDSNIIRVGHRRGMLNPSLGETGFGYASNSASTYKNYSANYVIGDDFFGTSSVESVVWPARNTPIDLFANNDPWSYSSYYYTYDGSSAIDIEDVKVVLQKLDSNGNTTKTWTFDSNNKSENYNSTTSGNKYFGISTSNSGGRNDCLIFRPDDVIYSAGDIFKVTITNLTGTTTIDEYEVNFFDINDPQEEKLTVEKPVFTTNLSSTNNKTYIQGDTTTALTVEVNVVTDVGNLSYQWYKDGEAISGATENTYLPLTDEQGTFEYTCVVTNTLTESGVTGTNTTTSGIATITINEFVVATPVISSDLSEMTVIYLLNETNADNLTITANSTDSGTLSYQWYKVISGGNDQAITGETDTTFTPPVNTMGTSEYYCIVTNTLTKGEFKKTATSTSKTASIQVKVANAETPIITTDLIELQETEVAQGSADTKLEIIAKTPTDGGTLSYQWYQVVDSADDIKITNATNSAYTPNNSDLGTYKYYCVVTNTNLDAVNTTATTISKTATFVVKLDQAEMPVITTNLSRTPIIYNIDDPTSNTSWELEVNVENPKDGGTLSYQWYKGKVAINGAIDNTYTVEVPVDNSELGIKDYYCVVTNTNQDAIQETTSVVSYTSKFLFESDTFKNTETPNITEDLPTTEKEINLGVDITLNIEVKVESETAKIAYNWYQVFTDGTKDELVYGTNFGRTNSEEDFSTFTPDINKAGTYQYYCLVTNTDESATGDKNNSLKSNVITIIVAQLDSAETPTIDTNLVTETITYTKGDTATELEVIASVEDGGDLSYQWYKNGTEISGATNKTYTPITTTVGTNLYYCVVTNTNNNATTTQIATETSNTTTIKVVDVVLDNAEAPTITSNLPYTTLTYNRNDSSMTFVVKAEVNDGGTLSYQWYKNGEVLSGEESSTYKPSTNFIGMDTYYCIVTNTNNNTTATTKSNTVGVIVNYTYYGSYGNASNSSSSSFSSSTGSSSGSSSGANLGNSASLGSAGSSTAGTTETTTTPNTGTTTPTYSFSNLTDVSNHWANNDIKFMVDNGYLVGMSEYTFEPNTTMSTAMFITVLNRIDAEGLNNLTSSSETWFGGAEEWVTELGLDLAIPESVLSNMNNGISREAMSKFLYNYINAMDITLPSTIPVVNFTDGGTISSWSAEAIAVMQKAGIISGRTDGSFDPLGTATRAEVSSMLRRFVELVK